MNHLAIIAYVLIGFVCGLMVGVLIGYKLYQSDNTDQDPDEFFGGDDYE